MRTTLTLEPDVAAEIERRRQEHGSTLKQEVNDLLRLGLRRAEAQPETKPFRTRTVSMGEMRIDITSVSQALEEAEGPGYK
jgi:hypothetical protein